MNSFILNGKQHILHTIYKMYIKRVFVQFFLPFLAMYVKYCDRKGRMKRPDRRRATTYPRAYITEYIFFSDYFRLFSSSIWLQFYDGFSAITHICHWTWHYVALRNILLIYRTYFNACVRSVPVLCFFAFSFPIV